MSALRGDRLSAITRLLAAGFTPDAAEEAVEALRPAVGIGFRATGRVTQDALRNERIEDAWVLFEAGT